MYTAMQEASKNRSPGRPSIAKMAMSNSSRETFATSPSAAGARAAASQRTELHRKRAADRGMQVFVNGHPRSMGSRSFRQPLLSCVFPHMHTHAPSPDVQAAAHRAHQAEG